MELFAKTQIWKARSAIDGNIERKSISELQMHPMLADQINAEVSQVEGELKGTKFSFILLVKITPNESIPPDKILFLNNQGEILKIVPVIDGIVHPPV